MAPARVLMVSVQFLPDMGGVETHVYETARRLAASGEFEITVLATDRSRSKPASEIIDGLSVLRVPSWPRARDWYLAPALSGVVARPQQWDLVHCQGIHTPVPVQAMRAALRSRIPYVVTFHTGGHSLGYRNALRSIQWRLIGPLLRRADSLVAVSRFEAGKLAAEAHLGGKPISVIRNGGTLPVPPSETRSVPGRIVSPGRLERYKGHHRVIEALPHVLREVPEGHVVILGKGSYEAELRSLAARVGVSDRVTIGHVEPADRKGMAIALAEARVVAALSDYEAHPVAVMEALGIGRPVVGYATAGIGELVEEGLVHGVKPGASALDAAAALVRAMTQQDARALPEMPTWDTTARELAAVYRTVLRTRQPASVRGAVS